MKSLRRWKKIQNVGENLSSKCQIERIWLFLSWNYCFLSLRSPWQRVSTTYWYALCIRASWKVPSARLTLHSTKLCTKFKIFRREKFFFGTKVTSEAFLSISQILKVTRLQGGTQTKLWTCWRNFDLSRSFERFLGLVHGFAVLHQTVWPKML
jgi:hypothetical protein